MPHRESGHWGRRTVYSTNGRKPWALLNLLQRRREKQPPNSSNLSQHNSSAHGSPPSLVPSPRQAAIILTSYCSPPSLPPGSALPRQKQDPQPNVSPANAVCFFINMFLEL